ncbi:MAG: tetratricopeptide repeat protein [Bacteroidia bacterium]|nr:tetratricopeptide repeat protein [Bacteroidia bacterium]
MNTEEQTTENKGIESLIQFFEKHKKNAITAGIAMIVLACAIYYYNDVYAPEKEMEAADSFFMAERYFGLDSMDKALMGDGVHLGMIDIADEFESTKIGNQASYYAGRILLDQGKFEEALDYLNAVSMDDEIMAAQLITLRGDCYSEMEDYEKAGKTYMNAASKRDNELTAPYALMKAGAAFEESGSYNAAADAYREIEESYPNSRQAELVKALVARVKAKQAN